MEGLLTRISTLRGEDSCTEVLASLLRCAEFRSPLLRLLGVADGHDDIDWDIGTQGSHEHGRPDLQLSHSKWILRVENKLDAALTDHQPVGYLQDLHRHLTRADTQGFLTFCVPDWRKDGLSAEIEERVNAAIAAGQLAPSAESSVRLITWGQVISALAEATGASPVGEYLRTEFIGLMQEWTRLPHRPVPIGGESLMVLKSPATASAVVELADLVLAIRDELKRRGWSVAPSSGSGDMTNYGFSIARKAGGTKVWFGYFFRATAHHSTEHGPLWLQIGDSTAQAALSAAGYACYEMGDWAGWGGWLVATPLPLAGSREEQLSETTRTVEDMVALVFGPAGG